MLLALCFHFLLSYAMPIACGSMAGWIVGRARGRSSRHAVGLVATVLGTLAVRGFGPHIFAAFMTGHGAYSLASTDLAYNLALLRLKGAGGTVALAILGYALGVRIARRRGV